MANQQNSQSAGPALLFIPDISGFTDFVTNTEISHSQHIIEELLEIIVDANDIGLQVNEIEGDAILFYRMGNAPTAAELLHQVQKMFTRFHAHLKKYQSHRICNCGACRSANQLTLKFVAHYGDISLNTVKQYKKLFGTDVIVAHRLLKNDIQEHEYALFTDTLMNACPQWVDIDTTTWARIDHGTNTYDSGTIKYCYIPLQPLLELVPEPSIEDHSIPGLKKHMTHREYTLDVPMELAFNVISDLPWRSKWIPGTIEKVEDMNSQLTQNGQTHRCLAKGPVIVAHDFHSSPEMVTFTETDLARTYCVVFTLYAKGKNTTLLTLDLFLKKNPLKQLLFRMFMQKSFLTTFDQSIANLNAYCKDLVAKGKEHPYWVVLEERQAVAA